MKWLAGNSEDLISGMKYGGIMITSYTSVLIHKEALLKVQWHYVILDEGHKIRNPEAKVKTIRSINNKLQVIYQNNIVKLIVLL